MESQALIQCVGARLFWRNGKLLCIHCLPAVVSEHEDISKSGSMENLFVVKSRFNNIAGHDSGIVVDPHPDVFEMARTEARSLLELAHVIKNLRFAYETTGQHMDEVVGKNTLQWPGIVLAV